MRSVETLAERIFMRHRRVLVGIAYRVLGSSADAEDVVQDAWLRWSEVDADAVADAKPYLITITTRLAIDRLRRVRARREAYVGPWLPEPLATDQELDEHAELAESVELAMLVVLETLTPLQRAVFVLREAFELPYAEIARVIGRDEAATRQLASRARADVAARRPRFDGDRVRRRAMTEQFLSACATGDLGVLAELLAADVALTSDGGGKAKAPRRVITGVDKVSRFFAAISSELSAQGFMASIGRPPAEAFTYDVVDVNAAPAIVVRADGRPILVVSVVVADGLIRHIYLMANPDKLAGMPRQPGLRTGEAMSQTLTPAACEGA